MAEGLAFFRGLSPPKGLVETMSVLELPHEVWP